MRYSTVEQQTTELFTPLTFGSKKPIAGATTRCQSTKLLLIFFGIVSVLSLTLCGFNNLVVDYTTTTTTTTPINTTTTTTTTPITTTPITTTTTTPITTTTTTPITTTTTTPITTTPITTTPITTTPITTTPITTTTTTPEETTLQLLRTPETRPGDVVITNKTIVINEVNNSLTVFD